MRIIRVLLVATLAAVLGCTAQDEAGFARVEEPELVAVESMGSPLPACWGLAGDGAVAYWQLDGSGRDASGNGNDGELLGAIPTADRFGRARHALHFDGVDDLVLIPNSPKLQIGLSDYTIAAWVKMNGTSGYGRIFSKGSWACSTGYMMRLQIDKVHLENASAGQCMVSLDGGTSLADGRWHFVVGVVHRHLGAEVYVDGVLDATQMIDTSPFDLSNNRNPTIGASDDWVGYPDEFWNGSIDSVRVYDSALSEREIRTLMWVPPGH